jgi:hypothetical protein
LLSQKIFEQRTISILAQKTKLTDWLGWICFNKRYSYFFPLKSVLWTEMLWPCEDILWDYFWLFIMTPKKKCLEQSAASAIDTKKKERCEGTNNQRNKEIAEAEIQGRG